MLKISNSTTFAKFGDLTFVGKIYWAADTKIYTGRAHHPQSFSDLLKRIWFASPI